LGDISVHFITQTKWSSVETKRLFNLRPTWDLGHKISLVQIQKGDEGNNLTSKPCSDLPTWLSVQKLTYKDVVRDFFEDQGLAVESEHKGAAQELPIVSS